MNRGGKVVVNRVGNTVHLVTEEGLAPAKHEEEISQRRRRYKSFDAAADYKIESSISKGQISAMPSICKKNHDIDV